jgi:hypothetical protein
MLKGLLPFALALVILSLDKPIKLKIGHYIKKERKKVLQPVTNSPKLSSDVTSKDATKLFKFHLSLIQLIWSFHKHA